MARLNLVCELPEKQGPYWKSTKMSLLPVYDYIQTAFHERLFLSPPAMYNIWKRNNIWPMLKTVSLSFKINRQYNSLSIQAKFLALDVKTSCLSALFQHCNIQHCNIRHRQSIRPSQLAYNNDRDKVVDTVRHLRFCARTTPSAGTCLQLDFSVIFER